MAQEPLLLFHGKQRMKKIAMDAACGLDGLQMMRLRHAPGVSQRRTFLRSDGAGSLVRLSFCVARRLSV